MQLCRKIPASNFKSIYDSSLVSDDLLEKVPPTGEVKSASLDDERYEVKVEDWSRMIHVSREDIINDELLSVTNVGRLLGAMASRTLEEQILKMLLNAPIGTTDEYFLSADTSTRKRNYIGSSSNLDKTLRSQTSPRDKQPLSFAPSFLIVGDSDATIARELCGPNGSFPMPVLESSWLHSGLVNATPSHSQFFVAHVSDAGAPLICAFLGGVSRPEIAIGESSMKQLGISMRATLSFGLALGDGRTIVQSAKTS